MEPRVPRGKPTPFWRLVGGLALVMGLARLLVDTFADALTTPHLLDAAARILIGIGLLIGEGRRRLAVGTVLLGLLCYVAIWVLL